MSKSRSDGSLTILQDARVYLTTLTAGESVGHELATGRHAWLQVLRGAVEVAGAQLQTSDGLAVSGEPRLDVKAAEDAEVMLFDLA
jgi:redox-sensitive bicupin YhaK (pirin superfamily)